PAGARRPFRPRATHENPSGVGDFSRSGDLDFRPKRVRRPHPPIWIGGDSPGAFRRVAELGDGWHATSKTPAQFAEALTRLRAAADAARRPFESIELSLRFGLSDDLLGKGPPAVIDTLGEYRRLGLRHVLLD